MRWFNLEHCITSDPQKMLVPLELSKTEEVDPVPTTLEDYRMDWEQLFREDKDYLVYLPELLYRDITRHCALSFPDNRIQCAGQGDLTSIELRVKPLSVLEMSQELHAMDKRLCEARREIRQLHRRLAMMESNLGLAVQAIVAWCPDVVPRLHADTPAAWYEGHTEEY